MIIIIAAVLIDRTTPSPPACSKHVRKFTLLVGPRASVTQEADFHASVEKRIVVKNGIIGCSLTHHNRRYRSAAQLVE